MDKKFNSEMNLVKMIGIVHVVVSHIYASLFSIIRQSYSFHMPLFYFVSGYFYDEKHESEKTKYIWSKFKKDVGLFYFYYFLLIIFCLAFQWKYNISLGNVSIYTLLVQPFTTGEMGFMMGPAWFLLSLFLVQFLFVLIFPIIRIFFKNIYLQFCFFFSLSLISVILNNRTVNINEFVLMMYRTLIGLFFYFLGFFL